MNDSTAMAKEKCIGNLIRVTLRARNRHEIIHGGRFSSYSNQASVHVLSLTERIEVLLQIHCQVFEYQVEPSIGENNVTQPTESNQRCGSTRRATEQLTERYFDGEVLSRWRSRESLSLVLHHLPLLVESFSGHRSVTLADGIPYTQCRRYLE